MRVGKEQDGMQDVEATEARAICTHPPSGLTWRHIRPSTACFSMSTSNPEGLPTGGT